MNTESITPELLGRSVIAVPPLARHQDHRLNHVGNAQIIRYLEAGGITTLLYGGNAVFYHISLGEYAEVLRCLANAAGANTTVIPSVGPAFGTMMDQVLVLKEFAFPTVMILPQGEIATSSGRAQGTRIFAESYGKPIVLYLKHENAMSVGDVQRIVDEGIVCAIKYAVVHQDPAKDEYLKHLIDVVDPNIIVSGIGEQPAIVHLRQFHLNGFTSGCVCVQPALSQEMLRAIKGANWERAEEIRKIFQPLEDLRNSIHPIRVLHAAVRLAGIADTGPILPLLSPTTLAEDERIEAAAKVLLSKNEH